MEKGNAGMRQMRARRISLRPAFHGVEEVARHVGQLRKRDTIDVRSGGM